MEYKVPGTSSYISVGPYMTVDVKPKAQKQLKSKSKKVLELLHAYMVVLDPEYKGKSPGELDALFEGAFSKWREDLVHKPPDGKQDININSFTPNTLSYTSIYEYWVPGRARKKRKAKETADGAGGDE